MLKKGQHRDAENLSVFEQFYALAAQLRPVEMRLPIFFSLRECLRHTL